MHTPTHLTADQTNLTRLINVLYCAGVLQGTHGSSLRAQLLLPLHPQVADDISQSITQQACSPFAYVFVIPSPKYANVTRVSMFPCIGTHAYQYCVCVVCVCVRNCATYSYVVRESARASVYGK
jgi:hypothetical protein